MIEKKKSEFKSIKKSKNQFDNINAIIIINQSKIVYYFIAYIDFIIFIILITFIIFKSIFEFIVNFDVLNKKIYKNIKFKIIDKT